MPWAWHRRQLAKAWGIPPWEVDEAPREEINLEMKLATIESEALIYRQQHPELYR